MDLQDYKYIKRNLPFTFTNCCRVSASAHYCTKLLEVGLHSAESQDGRLTGQEGCGYGLNEGVTSELSGETEKAHENLRS